MTAQNSSEGKAKIEPNELVHFSGFDKAFTKLIAREDVKTHEQAFNQLNELYQEHFGKERYASFDSYRVSRNKRLRS